MLAIILLTYPPCKTVTRIFNEHASGNDDFGGGHTKEKAKRKTTLANNFVNTPPVQIITAIPYDFLKKDVMSNVRAVGKVRESWTFTYVLAQG